MKILCNTWVVFHSFFSQEFFLILTSGLNHQRKNLVGWIMSQVLLVGLQSSLFVLC